MVGPRSGAGSGQGPVTMPAHSKHRAGDYGVLGERIQEDVAIGVRDELGQCESRPSLGWKTQARS